MCRSQEGKNNDLARAHSGQPGTRLHQCGVFERHNCRPATVALPARLRSPIVEHCALAVVRCQGQLDVQWGVRATWGRQRARTSREARELLPNLQGPRRRRLACGSCCISSTHQDARRGGSSIWNELRRNTGAPRRDGGAATASAPLAGAGAISSQDQRHRSGDRQPSPRSRRSVSFSHARPARHLLRRYLDGLLRGGR